MRTSWLESKTERGFWRLTVVLFALMATVLYLPVLAGQIPFPRDVVVQFSAWQETAHLTRPPQYADIGDLVTAFYPARALTSRAIHEGTLPLWNPYFLGGAPFLANPQSSLFYPPNFLYYILPLPTAWALCLMLRVFLAGLFMTLLVRHIGGSKAGSLFSGMAFTLCAFLTAWQGQPMADSAAWLPLTCYAVLRLADGSSNRWIALAAFSFAMPVLAGHPETAAHVTLVTIAIAVFTWVSTRFDRRFAGRFAIAGCLAGALACIQILPTFEWLMQMPGSLHIIWPALSPHEVLGWVSRDIGRSPNSVGIFLPESAAYAGMITLIAAPLGLLHRSRRNVLFFATVTILALTIAYGVEPVRSIVNHVPVVSALKNTRMTFLANFGFAALAGLGISVLEENPPAGSRRLLTLLLIMAAVAAVFLLVYELRLATEFRVEITRRPSFSRTLLIVGAIPLLLRLYGLLSASTFSRLACAIVALDLLTLSYGYIGYAAKSEIFPNASLFDFLAKNGPPSQFRVATIDIPYSTNANIVYGIASADGYEVRVMPWNGAFSLDYSDPFETGIIFKADPLLRINDRRLDLLNVKYLVLPTASPNFQRFNSAGRYSLAFNNRYVAAFENKSVMPRGFLLPAKGMSVLPNDDDQLRVLRDPAFDPEKTFTVSTMPDALKQQPQTVSNLSVSNHVDIVSSHINDVVLRAASAEPSVLILSQTYYPGWRAEVDGKRTDVFRADLSLTGVVVPAGSHDVRFVFRPNSVLFGAALSAIAVVVLLLISFAPASPRHR
jgi:hypothetical protein